ncbi:early nodulin-like protein 3 [Nymphaea colorata]|nr:early nodulin-like protein 3 [Nymphaea colorata]
MASRAVAVSFSLTIFLLFSCSEAVRIPVGGRNTSWSVPSSTSQTLNQWAEQTRFQIGDVLVWNYNPQKDSVLQVTFDDYQKCNTSNPIAKHTDGNTTVTLDRSGPFYFISGVQGNCQKGEKLIVVVLSPRVAQPSMAPASSPASEGSPSSPPMVSASTGLDGFRLGFSALVVTLVTMVVGLL